MRRRCSDLCVQTSDRTHLNSTHGIALIVGGHSHSLLLNEPNDDAVGRYPTPVVNTLGKTTYVVQAHRYGDYLGNVLVECTSACHLHKVAALLNAQGGAQGTITTTWYPLKGIPFVWISRFQSTPRLPTTLPDGGWRSTT